MTNAEHQRKWYLNNQDKQKQKVKKNRSRLKKVAYDYKSSHPCVRCGFNDPRALQFHHLDPSGKDFTISDSIQKGRSVQTLLLEIEKCVVLCANCHQIEHFVYSYE